MNLSWLLAWSLTLALGASDVATVDLARDAREWRGAWVVRDADYPGSVQAWSVNGSSVSVYDATRRRTEKQRFSLVSPCRIARTRTLPDGTSVKTYDTFVFARDGLHVAQAPASGGFRRDGRVTACIDDHVYTFEVQSTRCRRYSARMAGPSTSVECTLTSTGASSSFVVRPLQGDESSRIDFYGDALLSRALLAHVAERSPSFYEAQRRADRLR
jgi:hypothetical protein